MFNSGKGFIKMTKHNFKLKSDCTENGGKCPEVSPTLTKSSRPTPTPTTTKNRGGAGGGGGGGGGNQTPTPTKTKNINGGGGGNQTPTPTKTTNINGGGGGSQTPTPTPTKTPFENCKNITICSGLFDEHMTGGGVVLELQVSENDQCCCDIQYSLDSNVSWTQLLSSAVDCNPKASYTIHPNCFGSIIP